MYSVIGGDGQVYGPVDVPTLQRWCAEGRVAPTTHIIETATGRQMPAASAPILNGYFAIQPAAPNPMSPPMSPMSSMQSPSNYYRGFPGGFAGQSSKSKLAAILLAIFLGAFGIHRFYLGHTGSAVAMLLLTVLTCGYGGIITGIWALIDALLIATDSLTDVNGLKLS